MSQPPRKAPSQPGLKQATQGHAKKARPNRSNSQSKPPVVKATDGYAMGSYDNDIAHEPASTPSWMRDTPSEPTLVRAPSSPSFPTSPSPNVPTPSNNLVAPIPFHLPTFAPNPSAAPMQPFAPTFAPHLHAPFGLLPPAALIPLPAPNGLNGLNPPATGLSQPPNGFNAYLAPPASAPPSTHPLQNQDAIARILALQQANAHMSTSTTPLGYAAPQEAYNQNSVNFSRNFTEDPRTCQPVTAPMSSVPVTPMTNPFAPASSTPSAGGMAMQNKPLPSVTAASPFAVASTTPAATTTSHPPTGASVSLDHLMSMQQQANQIRQSLDQLRMSRPQSASGDSIWQLQVPSPATGTGKSAHLAVANDGSLRVSNGNDHATDFLFEPSPASRLPLKTSAKLIPNPRSAPIHAHHNYGVPAQP